jgi:hypothetical protein
MLKCRQGGLRNWKQGCSGRCLGDAATRASGPAVLQHRMQQECSEGTRSQLVWVFLVAECVVALFAHAWGRGRARLRTCWDDLVGGFRFPRCRRGSAADVAAGSSLTAGRGVADFAVRPPRSAYACPCWIRVRTATQQRCTVRPRSRSW